MMKEPSRREASPCVVPQKVFQWWDYPLFILLTGLSFASMIYFSIYWLSFEDWRRYPVSFSILTIIVAGVLLNHQLRWFLLLWMRKPKPLPIRSKWKVAVVTTFTPEAEPLEMLAETLKALVGLEYPHDTWVLDEGDDERVKALCRKLGAYHFSRKPISKYQTESGTFQSRTRHGNYNAWLFEVGFDGYDIITQFDTDHVPNRAFLFEVLGYFEDSTVGYVQVAQVYYNQKASFIARGAAEETYGHYSCTQMASFAMGYPIVTGCHSTHRVTALKHVGGFPAHNADDLLITLLYRTSGWRGVYVPRVLAKGLTPVDWNGYLIQQLKWAHSVLDIKLWTYPQITGSLPVGTRVMGLFHGLSYVQNSLLTFIGLLLTAVILATGSSPSVISYAALPRLLLLCGTLQICELYRQRFYLDWRTEWGWHWRKMVLRYAKWPFHFLALYQALVRHQASFPINSKFRSESPHTSLLWPHLLVIILLCAALLIGATSGRVAHPLVYIWAFVIVAGSVALILTELFTFPDPYDFRLLDASVAGMDQRPVSSVNKSAAA